MCINDVVYLVIYAVLSLGRIELHETFLSFEIVRWISVFGQSIVFELLAITNIEWASFDSIGAKYPLSSHVQNT